MSDALSALHHPALRVGGRRLSIGTRSKPHNIPSGTSAPTSMHPTGNADYPRPAPQGEGDEAQTHPPPHNEEEVPKREKKHGHGGHDQNRLKESAFSRLDVTMPSKDCVASKHTFGAAGRIGQPMGRALAV